MEGWTDFIAGRAIGPNRVGDSSVESLLLRLDIAAAELAEVATRIERSDRLEERRINPIDPNGAEASLGGAIVHALTHSMHHRAKVLYLMRRTGMEELVEGDVLSWEAERP